MIRFAVCFIVIILTFSLPVATAESSTNVEISEDPDNIWTGETWWVAADAHVDVGVYEELATSVEDVKHNLETDFAIMLGDMVNDTVEAVPYFDRQMDKLPHGWTYILGNHDFDVATGEGVKEPNYFSKIVEGIRIIALSDEVHSRNLELGEEQEEWFRDRLKEAPDIPTILMTHQGPDEPWYLRGYAGRALFWDEWLREEIEDYNIVAWIAGHRHIWDISRDFEDSGMDRIYIKNIGGAGIRHQSMVMSIEEGTVNLGFRDHRSGEWISVGDGEISPFWFEIFLLGTLSVSTLFVMVASARSKKDGKIYDNSKTISESE